MKTSPTSVMTKSFFFSFIFVLNRKHHWRTQNKKLAISCFGNDLDFTPTNLSWKKSVTRDVLLRNAAIWFLIWRNSFQSWHLWEKSFFIGLMRGVKIVIPILKKCLVNHDRFTLHGIFCVLSWNRREIRCPRERVFEETKDESYLEEKMGGWTSGTLYLQMWVQAGSK